MIMDTLVINGSPRENGNCAQIIARIWPRLGSAARLDAYWAQIAPCNDCRACHKTGECIVKDDMRVILNDDFNRVVIISPIYMGTLTPPMISLLTRFQADYAAKRFRKAPVSRRPKQASLILLGGGDGKPDEALRLGRLTARSLNAAPGPEDIHMYLDTDRAPAVSDMSFMKKLEASFD